MAAPWARRSRTGRRPATNSHVGAGLVSVLDNKRCGASTSNVPRPAPYHSPCNPQGMASHPAIRIDPRPRLTGSGRSPARPHRCRGGRRRSGPAPGRSPSRARDQRGQPKGGPRVLARMTPAMASIGFGTHRMSLTIRCRAQQSRQPPLPSSWSSSAKPRQGWGSNEKPELPRQVAGVSHGAAGCSGRARQIRNPSVAARSLSERETSTALKLQRQAGARARQA
jgi:hypothetical protein